MNIRNWLIGLLGACTQTDRINYGIRQYSAGHAVGQANAKTEFAILPLPFTHDQLIGKEYGTFITPAGFGQVYGECNIPAPGQYGYELRAGYLRKVSQDETGTQTVYYDVAEGDREHYTPAIVVVLR